MIKVGAGKWSISKYDSVTILIGWIPDLKKPLNMRFDQWDIDILSFRM